MNKLTLSITILAGIALVGVIALTAIDKSVTVLLPVLTALIGALAGIKSEFIAGVFTRKK